MTAGSLQVLGDDVSGELGIGSTSDSATPVQARQLDAGVSAVAAGDSHGIAVAHGRVYAWGANFAGQLGDGTTAYAAMPTAIPTLAKSVGCPAANPTCTPIAAGGAHSLALSPDGTVEAWGANNFGQLGDGSDVDRTLPIRAGIDDVVAIAAGGAHSLALRADGTVWAWGFDQAGQLGNGTTTNAPVSAPVQVSGLDHVVAIAAGIVHSVALRADGSVWTWGGNNFGQLGHAPVGAPNPLPAQVTGLGPGTTRAIAAGGRFTLALDADGTVLAWGHNDMGQLGNGTASPFKQNATPAPVQGLVAPVAIAAGGEFALALGAGGTLFSWGSDAHGQLGRAPQAGTSYQTTAGPVDGIRGGVLAFTAGAAETLVVATSPGRPPKPGVPLAPDPPDLTAGATQGTSGAPPPANTIVTPNDPNLPFVTDPTLTADPAHPDHLAMLSDSYDPNFGSAACYLGLSTDGGATWTTRALFGGSGPPLPGGAVYCNRPGARYLADGSLLVVFKADDLVYATVSTDGGATFATPQQLDLDVKTHGDPTERDFIGGDIGLDAQTGDVYVAMARFAESTAGRAPLFVLHCTATEIAAIAAGSNPMCSSRQASPDNATPGNVRIRTAMGPDHRVYVAWGNEADHGAGAFDQVGAVTAEVITSSDGGTTWSNPVYADRLRYVCPQARCASTEAGVEETFYDMSIAVTSAGVTVAMSGPRFGDDPHHSRVAISRSTGGTLHFTNRRVVGITSNINDQHASQVTAALDGSGGLAVVYYDLRPDGSQDTYAITSADSGQTFGVPVLLSDVSSTTDVLQGEDSRPGAVLTGSTVDAAWVDSRLGTPDTGQTDIAFARAPAS